MALRLLGLHAALDLVQRLRKALGLHGLHQVVNGVHAKGVKRVLAVGRHKYNGRRVLELVQGLGQLHAGRLGHLDVQEHDVHLAVHQALHGLAGA